MFSPQRIVAVLLEYPDADGKTRTVLLLLSLDLLLDECEGL